MQTNATSPNNVGWILRDVDRWRFNDRNMLGNVAWNVYRKEIWDRYLPRSPSETMVTEHSVRTLKPYNVATRFTDHENKRNVGRCWVKRLTISNFMQHCPAWCTNDHNMLHPTVLGDVAFVCTAWSQAGESQKSDGNVTHNLTLALHYGNEPF